MTSKFALYNDISYSSKGVATKLDITNAKEVISGAGTERVKNDVVGLNNKYYTYSKDCQVFHIDEDGDFDETVYTVSNIATDKDDNVWFVIDSGDVVAIFYQDVEEGKNPEVPGDYKIENITLNWTSGFKVDWTCTENVPENTKVSIKIETSEGGLVGTNSAVLGTGGVPAGNTMSLMVTSSASDYAGTYKVTVTVGDVVETATLALLK